MFYLLINGIVQKTPVFWHLKLVTPVVNFINILQAAFTRADSKNAKKTDNLTVFLHFWDLRVQKLLIDCWWNWPVFWHWKFVTPDVSNHAKSPFSWTYDEYLWRGTLSDGKSHLLANKTTGKACKIILKQVKCIKNDKNIHHYIISI